MECTEAKIPLYLSNSWIVVNFEYDRINEGAIYSWLPGLCWHSVRAITPWCLKKVSVCNHQLNCILGLLDRVKNIFMQSPNVIIRHSKCCRILESSPDATVCQIDSEIWIQIDYMDMWAKRCEGEGRAMGTSCCLELSLEQMYKLSSGKKPTFAHWLQDVFSTWTPISVTSISLKFLIIFGIGAWEYMGTFGICFCIFLCMWHLGDAYDLLMQESLSPSADGICTSKVRIWMWIKYLE